MATDTPAYWSMVTSLPLSPRAMTFSRGIPKRSARARRALPLSAPWALTSMLSGMEEVRTRPPRDLDVVRDGGGEDQAAQCLQALPDLLAQGRGGQVGQVDFLRLEAALLEVAPQGGHQAVVLIQEVALALRQAEVGEGTLRVALAGGGLALAVVLHKQVVALPWL